MTSSDHPVPVGGGPAGQSLKPGLLLAGLQVVGELGRGENTIVYRVRRAGREYALKILRSSGSDSAETVRLFRREAAVLAGLSHPGLPRIHQAGEDAGRPYLVMDLVEGRPLADLLSHRPMAAAQAISITLDVADALWAVHRAGLVHRDIKPQNIMVLGTGNARLIDFGFATMSRAREQDGRAESGADDVVVGTLAYAAPEQSRALARPVDQRSDLYSLGVVLFQCATGRLPFVSESLGELLRMHLTSPAPRADEIAVGVGPGLAAVIHTLLAKDPDDRYQSCDDLLADLRRLVADPGADLVPLQSGARPDRSPLAGRIAEFDALVVRWAHASRGQGGVCLVRGPSGIGKSRLIRELAGLVTGQGALVLAGKCAPDDAVPLAAVRAAIDSHLRDVATLPEPARTEAHHSLRRAAGVAASLLGALSPSLRTLLAAGELADEDRSGQFETAVVDLLRGLAHQYGGLMLVVDDVQWLDVGSLRLVTQLADELVDVPLLLVTTVRDDDPSRAAAERFTDAMGRHLDLDIALTPLDDSATAALIADRLPGVDDSPLATLLTARGKGNPFVVIEYLRAILDAGLVTPSWGSWQVDEEGLAALDLPRDAMGLVLARVQDMGPDSRRMLTVAAEVGVRFTLGLVAQVGGFGPARAAQLIQEAEERGLVEGLGGGRYAFLHDRIREALLANLGDAAAARLNQDIAEALDSSGLPDGSVEPTAIYAVARHYMLGTGVPAERIVEVCVAAARQAVEEHAPARAVSFMAHAESFGEFGDAAMHRLYGIAMARDGQHAEAKTRFAKALGVEHDQLRRAELRVLLANVFRANWDTTGTLTSVRDGLGEAGSRWPRNPARLVAGTVGKAAAGLFVAVTRIGAGSASGRTRERFSLVCDLHEVGAYGCIIGLQPKEMVVHALRGLFAAARLGPSPQYVRVVGSLGLTLGALGLRRSARKVFVEALRVAEHIGDPRLIADVASQAGAAEFLNNSDDGEAWEAVLSEHGRWLDAGRFADGVTAICWELACSGLTAETLALYERGTVKVRHERDTTALVTCGALAHTVLGEFTEASSELSRVHALLAGFGGRGLQANAVLTNLHTLVEQRDFGDRFDALVTQFREFVDTPRLMIRPHRMAIALEVIGRVAQYRSAAADPGTAGQSRRTRARARAAVQRLQRIASTPLLRARAAISTADLILIDGDARAALRMLAKVGPVRRDAPVIAFDAALSRARCHAALGHAEEARRQARYAKSVAVEQRWSHRERWVTEEFEISGERGAGHAHVAATTVQSEAYRERLRALEEISRASARVLDPDALARVALDKIIAILGADRAFLFLTGQDLTAGTDTGRLTAHIGRNDSGEDILTPTAYSSTLVERVRASREPAVLTGTDQGEAAATSSVVLHGLRSIMAAPIQLDGRLMGVVYLDSKVAKGIFTSDDVGILTTIANHVATAFATARAAQLELSVQVTRQQRDVAESLRRALSQMSAEHDPGRVLNVLLDTAARLLPCSGAWLAIQRADTPDEMMIIKAGEDHQHWAAPIDTEMNNLLGAPAPVVGDLSRPLPDALRAAPATSWLAIPMPGRAKHPAVLFLVSPQVRAYQEAQVELGSTLVTQGAAAFDNATLFTQVQRLATVDDLSGLVNRRTFFEQATDAVRTAVEHGSAVCAAMIDIDLFKRVNDTYGHLAGDDVIRAVAARLGSAVRTTDLVGRYGGEEFAMVMPDTDLTSATPINERLRMAVEDKHVLTQAGALTVTVSVGIAELRPGDTVVTLLARADAALYRAKAEGRNLVRTG